MQPNGAFHCVLSLNPASQRRRLTQCTWSYKEPMCPHWFSHSSEGSRGELLCYFSQVLSQTVFDRRPEGLSKNCWSWLAPEVPHAHGGGGRLAESDSVWRHPVRTVPCRWQRHSLFRGPANVRDWKSTEVPTGRRATHGAQEQVSEASWRFSFQPRATVASAMFQPIKWEVFVMREHFSKRTSVHFLENSKRTF